VRFGLDRWDLVKIPSSQQLLLSGKEQSSFAKGFCTFLQDATLFRLSLAHRAARSKGNWALKNKQLMNVFWK
jgi:hypothetical protein